MHAAHSWAPPAELGCSSLRAAPLLGFAPNELEPTFERLFATTPLRSADRGGLFSSIKRWALDALRTGPTELDLTAPPEYSMGRDVRSLTALECRGVLANAFLGNVCDTLAPQKSPHNRGGLCFRGLLQDAANPRASLGLHKLVALLTYFDHGQRASREDARRVVQWEHVRCPSADEMAERLRGCTNTVLRPESEVVPPTIRLHAGVMEDVPEATGFVNFANAHFGYGRFIPSCTQEEILQVCCPEFNVGLLFIGCMRDDEVVVVRRCRRFAQYTGYGDSFTCTGAAVRDTMCDILTLDACTARHYSRDAVLRDVAKAYTAFAVHREELEGADAHALVSTGKWGCGVFGGDVAHKCLQQALAARLAGVSLAFSARSPDGCVTLLDALDAGGASVAAAWELLQRCDGSSQFERQVAALSAEGEARQQNPSSTKPPDQRGV